MPDSGGENSRRDSVPALEEIEASGTEGKPQRTKPATAQSLNVRQLGNGVGLRLFELRLGCEIGPDRPEANS